MKKTVLAVSNDFVLDMRIYREATSLAKAGYEVVVVGIKRKGDRLPKEERVEGFRVVRVEVPNESSGWVYAIERVRQICQIARFGKPFFDRFYEKLVKEKADIYHANDTDTLLPCYKAKQQNNAKLVYDVHDLYGDVMSDIINYYWKKKMFIKWASLFFARENFKQIEKKYIKKADKIITVNKSLARLLLKKYRLAEEPTVIGNYPNFRTVLTRGLIRTKLGIDDNKKIILFHGSINIGRGLEEVVSIWPEMPKEFILVMLGEGSAVSVLRNLAKSKDLLDKTVFFLPSVTKGKIFNWVASADVGIIPFRCNNLNNYYSTPNKLFEYLLAGIPVLASNLPEISKVVKENKVGETFDPEDPRDLIRATKEIFSGKTKYKKMRENAFKVVKEKYNWGFEEKKLLSLYQELFEENKG